MQRERRHDRQRDDCDGVLCHAGERIDGVRHVAGRHRAEPSPAVERGVVQEPSLEEVADRAVGERRNSSGRHERGGRIRGEHERGAHEEEERLAREDAEKREHELRRQRLGGDLRQGDDEPARKHDCGERERLARGDAEEVHRRPAARARPHETVRVEQALEAARARVDEERHEEERGVVGVRHPHVAIERPARARNIAPKVDGPREPLPGAQSEHDDECPATAPVEHAQAQGIGQGAHSSTSLPRARAHAMAAATTSATATGAHAMKASEPSDVALG